MIRLAATMGAFAVAGCAAPMPPTWSATALVNREDGVVVVWRLAEYEGGAFNGFDNDPVVVSRARFDALGIAERDGQARVERLPVGFDYRRQTPGALDPALWISGGRVLPEGCRALAAGEGVDDATCPKEKVAGMPVPQLGHRGEDIVALEGEIVVGAAADAPVCRVPVPAALSAQEAARRPAAAYFASSRTLYLMDARAGGVPALFASRDCGAFVEIDYRPALQAASTMFGPEARDVRILDVAPGDDPLRPAVLFDWTERRDGVFVERTGVMSLATGTSTALDDDARRPVGFWGRDGARVLVAVRSEHPQDGAATMVLDIRDAHGGARHPLTAVEPLHAPGE